ncbi:restriction endonuclease [Burkholderia pseudomallei]|nr:restriction endonuclease [Burkholderia pseudomallei]
MYDFRTLSPLDFEELVRDLLQAEFGLLFESFGPGRDLGIDFRFATAEGSAVVQAKHYADTRADALVRTARAENDKVARLKPARYIFATSVSLTPMLKAKLQDAMPGAPLEQQDILGRADLNNLLGRHADVHKKHFKLWLASTEVLERILHSGVYNRTQAEMDVIKAMVPKFVQNDSVSEAEAILQKNGALIIAGEPGVGKSTLARMLVWLHAEQGWKISVIDDIGEAFAIASEDEKRLVFFDDFLGQIQLSPDLIRRTDQRFPPFLERLRTNKKIRFVLTTRDYILRQAQAQSSRLSAAKVNAAQFTLSVGHYTRATRAQILFNHIYFADISQDERRSLLRDDFFLEVIDHRNFNPRLIDLLTSADYVSIADRPIRETVRHVLDNPHELWEKPYRNHFTEEARGLMLALFFNEGRVGLQALEGAFQQMVGSMGLTIGRADIPVRFRAALKELEGSAIAIEDRHVRFANPGIRDFLQRAVREDRFFSVAVEAATRFPELKSTWKRYGEAVREDRGLAIDSSLWDAAIGRLMKVVSGTALDRLGLSVDMYDQLESETSLEFVRASVAELRDSEIELDEADLSRWVLEALSLSLLPLDVADEAGQVLFEAVVRFLSEWGGELSFEDIDAVAGALSDFDADAAVVAHAHRSALRKRTSDLSSILLDYGSVDDLDSFESELTLLMSKNGVPSGDVAAQVERRREILVEREQEREDENYNPAQSVSPRQSATDQIRSMFAGLAFE